jgi:hypothetical protein
VAHSDIMVLWPRTLLWTAGLLFAKMAMHLMLAHLCDEPFNPIRRTFVAVGVVALALWCAPLSPALRRDGTAFGCGLADGLWDLNPPVD